ncbi:MAG TPA: carbohydrate kinase family protein [Thermoanaerobaculia bacterium]
MAFDYLMQFPGRFLEHLIPDQMSRLSVSFLVDELRRVPGGCACNIAYGLALLGERPLLFATAGPDAAGYRDALAEEGIDVSGMKIEDDVFTASFFVSTDRDQNQVASFYTGAMARARNLSIRSLDTSAISLVVISPNDPEAMMRYSQECRESSIPFLYDPSQQVARLTGKDLESGLSGAAILIVNDYESEILGQKTGLEKADLESRVPVTIVTHGADGSTIVVSSNGGAPARHPIPPAKLEKAVADPTGVGDAYRAGLIRGIRVGASWPVAGRMGSLAAVITLESEGPQPPRYTIEQFVARYERSFGAEPQLALLTV